MERIVKTYTWAAAQAMVLDEADTSSYATKAKALPGTNSVTELARTMLTKLSH